MYRFYIVILCDAPSFTILNFEMEKYRIIGVLVKCVHILQTKYCITFIAEIQNLCPNIPNLKQGIVEPKV